MATPVTPALGRGRQKNREFKLILGYTASSGPAWLRETLLQQQNYEVAPLDVPVCCSRSVFGEPHQQLINLHPDVVSSGWPAFPLDWLSPHSQTFVTLLYLIWQHSRAFLYHLERSSNWSSSSETASQGRLRTASQTSGNFCLDLSPAECQLTFSLLLQFIPRDKRKKKGEKIKIRSHA